MNYLSNKLSKVISSPAFTNNRKTSSLNPSAASVKITTPTGDSKIVGACHRQQYYRLKGYQADDESTINVDWTLAAIMGEKMHDLLVDLIDVYGFQMGFQKITREHSIYDEAIKLSGRCDLLLWDYNNKEPVGVEIKSIGEYKCKKAIEGPIDEHVLQSVIYLDFYNKHIPDGQKKITKWYIWYVSRTENWSIKAKAHNSDFAMLWDYCIELENGIPIITLGDGTKQKWKEFSIENIYARYKTLSDAVATSTIPPRDYEIVYSEEKLTSLHKHGLLERKADKEAMDKWLAKGAPLGKLKIEMGDGECRFCEYSNLCWTGKIATKSKTFSNLPLEEPKVKPKPTLLL